MNARTTDANTAQLMPALQLRMPITYISFTR
jgi:hypothetical protein